MTRPPPISTLFPSPPLFRSVEEKKKPHRLFAGAPAVISGDADRRISDVHRKPERPSGSGAEQTRGICLRPLRHRAREGQAAGEIIQGLPAASRIGAGDYS